MFRCIFLCLVLLGAGCSSVNGPVVSLPSGARVQVQIADDQFERMRGLSGTTSLEQNEGLLFLHESKEIQHYWMKDMLIPIDIIWIDGNEVAGFVEEAQPQEPPLTIYSSPVPVDKVLEVSSGFVEENGLKVGDILDIELLNE